MSETLCFEKKIVFFIFVIHLNFRAKNIFDNMLNWLTQFV